MNLLKDLIYLVFPNTCAGCGTSLAKSEEEICLACLSAIEETSFHQFPNDNELFFRFAGKVMISGASSLFYFDKSGRLQKIISQLKYHHQRKIGIFLGKYYARTLQGSELIKDAGEIIPVPLHAKRLAERGYNQAEEFAKGLSMGLGIPVNTHSLVRSQATQSQTRKSKQERWENMKDVFEMTNPLSGKVILVDDVITTGATLEACVKTMLQDQEELLSIVILSIGCTRKD